MTKVEFSVSDKAVLEAQPKARFGPGNYKFSIVKVERGEASTGTPRLECTMLAEFDGRDFKVFDDVYLTKDSEWRYTQFCIALGLDPQDSDLDTDDMAGLEGVIRLKKPDDSDYMKVDRFYEVEEGKAKPLGPFAAMESKPSTDDVPDTW